MLDFDADRPLRASQRGFQVKSADGSLVNVLQMAGLDNIDVSCHGKSAYVLLQQVCFSSRCCKAFRPDFIFLDIQFLVVLRSLCTVRQSSWGSLLFEQHVMCSWCRGQQQQCKPRELSELLQDVQRGKALFCDASGQQDFSQFLLLSELGLQEEEEDEEKSVDLVSGKVRPKTLFSSLLLAFSHLRCTCLMFLSQSSAESEVLLRLQRMEQKLDEAAEKHRLAAVKQDVAADHQQQILQQQQLALAPPAVEPL